MERRSRRLRLRHYCRGAADQQGDQQKGSVDHGHCPDGAEVLRDPDPGNHRREATVVRQAVSLLVVCALAGPLHHASVRAQDPGNPSQRAAERIRQLQIEAGQLASREKSILAELRKLEIEREIRTEELTAIEKDQQKTRAQLATANVRAAELRAYADTQRPDVEARLVRLYKMGRAGYWRLLLDRKSTRLNSSH